MNPETINATTDLDAKVNPKDLASKTVNEKLIGMPISGKPWKKINKTAHSSVVKTGLAKKRTWQKKRELYDEQKAFRGKLREMREEENKIKEKKREAFKAKQKRKEENMLKGSSFQLIKNTDKVRRWNKKARSQLTKLPSSMFEQVLKKEYNY